jgi:DNA modification methylase
MGIKVEVLPIEQGATVDPSNVNKHTAKGRKLVENSLQRRGAFRSIASAGKGDGTPVVYAGNLTLQTAVESGFKEIVNVHVRGDQLVNVVRDDVEPGSAEAIALGLEDNESGKQSYNPDIDILAALAAGDNAILSKLREEDKTFNGMLEGMGLKDKSQDAEPQIDRAAELLEKWQVKTGDLWQIGEHRLLCGDSTDRAVVERVMGGEKAELVFTDPPYGMDLDADFSDMEGIIGKGNKYEDVIGDNKDYDPAHIFRDFGECQEIFLWGADYYSERIPNRNAGSWFVWDKTEGGIRTNSAYDKMFGSNFELCWSKTRHKRNLARVLWKGIFGLSKEPDGKRFHPTQKPVLLATWFLEKFSQEGQIVVDLFIGVGSVMLACQNLGRKCRAIEISPAYCAVILERMTIAFPELEVKRI